jgi:steroid delta-isomerase-like uncharacterized protein
LTKVNVYIDSCWNNNDLSKIKTIFSENYTRNVNNVQIASNAKELEANINVYFSGFPDLSISINNSVIKNNQVFFTWIFTGTNTNTYGEVNATGKKVKVSGFTRIVFNEEGKIQHEDVYYNELDFLQQLGYSLLPPVVD